LVVFHPTTTEYGGEQRQMQVLLSALDSLRIQTLVLWPNIDAGSDHISKAIRVYRSQTHSGWMRTLTNLSPEDYLKVLATTACAVGNSSSFVRDAGYFGTPVVLVGNRQNGRETDEHVQRVGVETEKIADAVKRQLAHGRYAPSTLYGDGRVAERIAAALEKLTPYLQKQLAFSLES
jgi:UDP-N-acetylglucosamine 2-epimerase